MDRGVGLHYAPSVTLERVYDLRADLSRLSAMQEVSRRRTNQGLSTKPHLVGSPAWWRAIERGRIATNTVEGTISDVLWTGMGDYPEFEVTTTDEMRTRFTREGEPTRYVPGLAVRIASVEHPWKDPSQFAAILGSTSRIVLSIDLETSPWRYPRRAPGPFADHAAVELWRPTGPAELALVEQSNFRAWPPRLPEQPIFYPVLSEAYATRIAKEWNVKASGIGFVTRFSVDGRFLAAYDPHEVGGRDHTEYWIPAEELQAFNHHIQGPIEVVAEYRETTS